MIVQRKNIPQRISELLFHFLDMTFNDFQSLGESSAYFSSVFSKPLYT